ncbi:SDR family oxidoreductase [Gracilibacillus timonensis]|uniref:SDR family oxidoreductase n=1 Tax=Gracilibacillus timonensis TaxID=1816696 RepID=UPI0021CC4677|nr:SDR family oxidoreductase [Gracilibacillus timonensis]
MTGGSMGIGQVLAIGLAQAGARVFILSRSSATHVVEEISMVNGEAHWIETDITKEEQIEQAIQQILAQTGGIDILVNNAAMCIHERSLTSTSEKFSKVMNLNVNAQFVISKYVAQAMVDKGTEGNIVNIASMSGSIVNIPQMQAAYNASKAALIHLTKSLAVEWAEYGIKVNSLSPGYVATNMSVNTPEALRDTWSELIPMKRMAKPEELISPLLFLVCDSCKYVTGSDIIVDGGYTAF